MWRLTISRKYVQPGISGDFDCTDKIELLLENMQQGIGIIEDIKDFGTDGEYEFTFKKES